MKKFLSFVVLAATCFNFSTTKATANLTPSGGAVTSVNGESGDVILDADNVGEGAVHLYYTNARAQNACVADAIVNGVTDVAPSQNAVFDALALKEGSISASTTAKYWRGDKSFQTLDTSVVPENGNVYFTNTRALAAPQPVGKVLEVDNSRTDSYVEDGSILHPYKDPNDAVAKIIANGDNDSTHPYTLFIAGTGYGTLNLSDAALVWVNVLGKGGNRESAVSFSTVNFTGANLFRGGIQNLNVATLNMTASAANNILHINNCKLGTANISNTFDTEINATQIGTFNLTSNTLVFYQNGYLGVTGVTTLVSSTLIVQASSLLNSATVDSASALLFRNGVRMVSGSITLNGVMQAYGAWIGVPITIGATGSLLNRGSFIDPANITNVAGGTYTQGTIGQMIGYTPTTSGDWSTVPTNVRGALDTLASGAVTKAFINGASSATNAPLVFKNGHIKSTQTTAPTAVVNANAGTGASCSVANATDAAGTVSLTTTGVASSSGAECAITFNLAYNVAPICSFTPISANAIVDAVIQGTFFTTSTSAATINFANTDAIGRTYQWAYQCIETQ